MSDNEKKKDSGIKNFISAQLGSLRSKNSINATNEAIEGMNLLEKAAKSKFNVKIEQKQGNFFEYIEAAKFNIDAASKGENIRAVVTESIGRPHDPADILICKNGKVLQEVQAKSSKEAKYAANYFRNPKYNGMQKLTNSDKAEDVRNLAKKRIVPGNLSENEYRDTYKNVTGELKYKDISSGGTDYNNVIEASKDTCKYIKDLEYKQFKNEIQTTSINSAKSSAIISGSVSIIKNGVEVYNNDKALEEAIIQITKDTAKSGIRGGVTGAAAAGIRIGAKKIGNKGLSNLLSSSTSSATLASAMLDVGVYVYSYARGDISEKELKDKMGEVGVKTISTVYISQAATSALGLAPGAFVPIAAYTLSYYVYSSCKTVLENARLKEEECERIIALYDEAIRNLEQQRAEMELAIQDKLDVRNRMFEGLINALDSNNYDESINALKNFALTYGKELKLAKFNDFDNFMLNNDTLKL